MDISKKYATQLQQQQQEAPAPPAPSTETQPPADAPPASDSTTDTTEAPPRNSKVITVPTGRMASIKREEREKGRRAALTALDSEAKSLGYASHEDMMQKLKANRGRPSAPAVRTAPTAPAESDDDQTPAPAPSKGRQTRAERELARAQEQRRAANRARSAAEKRARVLQRQREADQAEHALRLVAVGQGVKDTDYALTILQRKLSGMSQADLDKFDEEKFFSTDLRKTHPYLYGESTQPVTTSPTSDPRAPTSSPTPPKAPAPPAPAGDKKDARTMSRKEYEDALRARGLTPPQLGSPG